MTRTIIEKVKTKYGVRLEVNFGSVSSSLYFDDEAEYNGFVCMVRMMASMNAASVSVECPDPEEPEETDAQEKKEQAPLWLRHRTDVRQAGIPKAIITFLS